jgi:hypothetical protein
LRGGRKRKNRKKRKQKCKSSEHSESFYEWIRTLLNFFFFTSLANI